MANDLLSALRTYLTKISSGEKSPQEVAAALNAWAKESGEAIKERIEIEVKKNAEKMGFAKESDLRRIEAELREIRSLLKANGVKSPNSGSRKTKTAPGKRSAKASAKKPSGKNLPKMKPGGKKS